MDADSAAASRYRIHAGSFQELYDWLQENHRSAPFVWVNSRRGSPNGVDLNYLDVVYAALCFGWIDSTCKKIDGVPAQKLMPRRIGSHWSYLNVARCLYLEERGLMREEGLAAMPGDCGRFSVAPDLLARLQEDATAWANFRGFPLLYQRVRIDNIEWARHGRDAAAPGELFESRLQKLLDTSRQNRMYGQWDDYGRLRDLRLSGDK